MRIVAGKYRGRRLRVPEGREVRPTSERSREALFNILASGRLTGGIDPLPGARVLDAFAGSGALGFEAFSRGAGRVDFIETLPAALASLRQNLQGLEPAAALRILQADALRPPRAEEPVDLLLMDPPYGRGLAVPALSALLAAGWIGPGTLTIVEARRQELQPAPEGFKLLESRAYGTAEISFLELA